MGDFGWDKAEKVREKWEGLVEQWEWFSKLTFFAGLLLELTIVILDKSAYTIQYEGLWFRLTFLLFLLSVLTAKHSLREWIWLGILVMVGMISYQATGRNEVLRAVVFVWACSGVEMKKAFRLTFWYTAVGCLVLMLLSILGIAGEVAVTAVFRTQEETRYCLGMGHPNAFHCMMLAITFLGVYVYHQRFRWWWYGGILAAHGVIFFLSKSRAGFLVSIGALGLMIVLQYCRFLQEQAAVYWLGILVVIGAVGFSVFMACYGIENPFLASLDGFLTGRIRSLNLGTMNREGMLHTWSLWSVARNDYFFDLGIIRVFYWFGIIPGILYFYGQCRLLWAGFQQKDYMMLAVVVSITIYTIFEAHYVSDYLGRNYLLFFMGMYLKDMLTYGKKEKNTSG